MTEISPFRIAVSDGDLADLRQRLARTRWPESECVDDWSQGLPLEYARELAAYWADGYDWRAREAALNRFDQFTTEIDGLDVHFIHQRSPHADAFPLVITHGWPGSVVEFHKVIEPLTNPTAHGGRAEDAFHVVCPSLPGYGFSGKPTRSGWGVGKIAEAWETLMTRLGYDRYGAQGGDWGAAVTRDIGRNRGHCVGIHTNMPLGVPPADLVDPTEEEQSALAGAGPLPQVGLGLRETAVDTTADPGLRAGRLAGRPDGLDRREVLVLDGLRRPSRERAQPRRVAGQRDAVLDPRRRGVVGAAVLGGFKSFGPTERVELPTGVAAFPKEILRASAQLV